MKAIEENPKRTNKRRTRWKATYQAKKTDIVEESGLPKPPSFNRKIKDWIFSDDEEDLTVTPNIPSPKSPTPIADSIELPITPQQRDTPSPFERLPKLVTPPPNKSKPVASNNIDIFKKK